MRSRGVALAQRLHAAGATAATSPARWASSAQPELASPAFTDRPAAAAEPARAAPPLPPPALDFNNPSIAFKDKTTGELVRSLLVFRACQSRWLVNNADWLLRTSKRLAGSGLVNWAVGHTFYKQFVAGADAEGIKPALARLRRSGINPVLDYAAEDDVASEEGPKSREPGTASVVARTYSYEDEAECDRRLGTFLRAVDAARVSDGQGFAAVKVTALGPPRLLERASTALLAIRDLFRALDTNGDGWLQPDEFRAQYAKLFLDDSPERMDRVFSYLDTDQDGKVDYLAFTKQVSVRDGMAIASRCREQGAFAAAALSEEELRLLEAMLGRVAALAEAAAAGGVRLMVDAEHSYFQPAIDSLTAQLQRRYNRQEPLIFGTYQCYLRDARERLELDLERARREGYRFGCKLVRGAYMALERRHAADKGLPSPIWDSIDQTHAAYDDAVATLLPCVRDEGAEFMVASHNQASVERAVRGMGTHGLGPGAEVYFGQLLGMADNLTFTLGGAGYRAYKYVPFGGVNEVLPYLVRRAQENASVLAGVGRETAMMRAEVRRRLLGR